MPTPGHRPQPTPVRHRRPEIRDPPSRPPSSLLRRPLLGALAVAPLLLLGACSTTQPGDAEEPLDPSALVVYSGRSESLVGPLLEQFTQDTGVEVSVRYASSSALAAQLLEEDGRGDADVFFSQDAGALGAVADADLLSPLPQATLDEVEPRFRSDDGLWVGTTGRQRVMVLAADVEDDQVPSSVFDLTVRSGRAAPSASRRPTRRSRAS